MKWNLNSATGLIGLCRSGGRLHLAAVQRRGEQLQVVSCVSGEVGADAATLIGRLDPDVRNWPVAVTLPTEAGLHRPLEVPPADSDATEKMIELRLESLYPLEDTALRWGWQRNGHDHIAWIYLASGSAIDANQPALPPANQLAGAVSQEMAVVAQVRTRDPHASLVIVTGGEHHAGVAVLVDGKLHGIEQADLDGDEGEQLAALHEALAAATDDLDSERRPPRLLVLGPAAALGDRLAEHWHLQRVTTQQLLGVREDGEAMAAGAAIAALSHFVPAIAFEHDEALLVEDRRRRRQRVILAATWLIAALTALAVVDVRNAAMLEQEQLESVMSPQQRLELERDRALANYIQSLGPTPLAILDEIGQRTEGIQLDNIRYEANGDFRLRGTLRSREQVDELVNALSQAQTLDNVSLVSQRLAGRDSVEFEIVAVPNRRFVGAFVPPRTNAEDGSRQADTDPSGGNRP